MNLLVFSPWFPAPPDNGSRLRAFHLLRQWALAGHRIRLITGMQDDIADRADRAALDAICESVEVFPWKWHDGNAKGGLLQTATALFSTVPRSIAETDNPPLRAAVAAALARKPDAFVAMELAAAPLVPADMEGVPTLLDQIEISGVTRAWQHARSPKARLQAGLTKSKHDHYWHRKLRRFEVLTAVSEEEAAAITELIGAGGPPVAVTPNGVDVGYYPERTAPPVPGRMIYNGALTYGPNRDAVAWFVRDILPAVTKAVPEAHLVVTGRYPEDVAREYAGQARVTLTGFLPDLRPALAEATLCAVPLLGGGGTRLKILEAWAAGIPVVSTTQGAVGLAGSAPDRELLIADTAEAFAAACVRLLTEPETARRLAQNARQLVAARYDWPAIARQMIALLTVAGK